MKKQGKILRDTRRGPGLLILEGQQFSFSLSAAWRSEQLPAPGMPVEVEFDSGGEILSIRPAAEIRVTEVNGRAARIFGKLLALGR